MVYKDLGQGSSAAQRELPHALETKWCIWVVSGLSTSSLGWRLPDSYWVPHYVYGEATMTEPVRRVVMGFPTPPRNRERSLGTIMAEIKDELQSFINTRVRMIKTEFQESLGSMAVGLGLSLLCLGLLAIASLLFTAAVVAVIASAFQGNPFAWFLAFVIVGAIWSAFAAIAGIFAYRQFRNRFPKRTIEVLKADKVWLQSEARSRS